MKKILKRLSLVFILSVFILNTVSANENKDIKLIVNGFKIDTEEKPFIENGRTLVPVRVISENLGYKVNWVEKTNQVKITKDGQVVTLTVGDRNVEVRKGDIITDGEIDVSPKIVKDRVFVPLRFIAETYDEKIGWNENMRLVWVGDYKFILDKDVNLKSRERREFPEIGLVMYLPKDFDEKIMTRLNIENNAYEFYTKDRGEYLASIAKAYDRSMSEIIPTQIIKYEDGFFTEINYPSDVQFTKETEKDYFDKLSYLKDVFQTIEFEKNLKEEEKFVGYINGIDFKKNEVNLDPAEFISINNLKRQKDLMIGKDMGPNVYNDKDEEKIYKLSKDCKFYIRRRDDVVVNAYEVDRDTFKKYFDSEKIKSPFWVKFDGDEVKEFVEIYIKPGTN